MTYVVGDTCAMITQHSCPAVRLADHGDGVIQLFPKLLPPDHPIAKRPEIAGHRTKLMCAEPGAYLGKPAPDYRVVLPSHS